MYGQKPYISNTTYDGQRLTLHGQRRTSKKHNET